MSPSPKALEAAGYAPAMNIAKLKACLFTAIPLQLILYLYKIVAFPIHHLCKHYSALNYYDE